MFLCEDSTATEALATVNVSVLLLGKVYAVISNLFHLSTSSSPSSVNKLPGNVVIGLHLALSPLLSGSLISSSPLP